MLIAATTLVLFGCGSSGTGTASPTTDDVPGQQSTTEASGPDAAQLEEAREEYLDAMTSADWGGLGPSSAECLGNAAIDAVGVEVLLEEKIDPDAWVAMDSLVDLGLEIDEEATDEMAMAIRPCFDSDFLTPLYTSMFQMELSDEMLDCFTEPMAEMMGQVLAVAFATGEDTMQEHLAELMAAGSHCRWEADPATEDPDLTVREGLDAFVAAVAAEIQSVPPGTLSMNEEEATCTASGVIDVIGEETLLELGTTARGLSQYIDGREPESIGLVIDVPTSERLADAVISCLGFRSMVDEIFGLMLPPDAREDMVDCILEQAPEETWRQSVALQFRLGTAGLQGPEGQATMSELMAIGASCGSLLAGQ